jgi:multisubunit Na+/H+ antiporter MnhG subunit
MQMKKMTVDRFLNICSGILLVAGIVIIMSVLRSAWILDEIVVLVVLFVGIPVMLVPLMLIVEKNKIKNNDLGQELGEEMQMKKTTVDRFLNICSGILLVAGIVIIMSMLLSTLTLGEIVGACLVVLFVGIPMMELPLMRAVEKHKIKNNDPNAAEISAYVRWLEKRYHKNPIAKFSDTLNTFNSLIRPLLVSLLHLLASLSKFYIKWSAIKWIMKK